MRLRHSRRARGRSSESEVLAGRLRQVAFEKALGVEKEIFLCKESVAEEEIFGEGIDEEEVAFKDCVSLRRES